MPVLVFALNEASLPNPGLTPENPFYFLDKVGEALREFLTFNPEAKARLQITFAAERIAEIKVVLETKGIQAPGLDIAQARLHANIAKAATIIENEKQKGKDVSELAKSINDEFKAKEKALEQAFEDQEQVLEIKEDELKLEIRKTRLAGDTAKVEELVKQLGEVKAQKELLELKEEEQEEILEQEEERLEEGLEAQHKAEEAIKEAEEELEKILADAKEEGIEIRPDALARFNSLISSAKSSLAAGDFAQARQLAKQAERILEDIEEAIEELEEQREEEEDMAEDEEEQEEEENED